MKMRRLALGILLYVSADFGNPFVGAAFTFDANTSLEMLQHQRERASERGTLVALPRVVSAQAIRLPFAAISRSDRHRLPIFRGPDLPRAQTFTGDPPTLSEDH
jgi:hypothetical protein